jgi:hypothetical protein
MSDKDPGIALDLVEQSLVEGVELPELDDPDEIARQIIVRILKADDVEQVLEPAGALGARDLLGVPLEISAVRWQRSSLDGGPALFALIEAQRLDEGEPVVVTCGGRNVLAQLLRLAQLSAFPQVVRIVEAERETSRGYRPLWLVPAQKGAKPPDA